MRLGAVAGPARGRSRRISAAACTSSFPATRRPAISRARASRSRIDRAAAFSSAAGSDTGEGGEPGGPARGRQARSRATSKLPFLKGLAGTIARHPRVPRRSSTGRIRPSSANRRRPGQWSDVSRPVGLDAPGDPSHNAGRGPASRFTVGSPSTERMPPKGVGRPWSSRVPASRACWLLVLGLLLGWRMATIRPAPLAGRRGDRRANRSWPPARSWSATTRGTRSRSRSRPSITWITRAGGCWRRFPRSIRPSGRRTISSAFAERDLVADFKLDLDNGPRPHFLMTTGSLGTYGDGLGAALRLRDDHEPGRASTGSSSRRSGTTPSRGSS